MDDKFKKMTEIAVNDTDMTNALLGKVFDVLTSGGTVGMESGNNFYCWLPVGQAVMPDQFEFLEQGLTGTLRKRSIGDVNDKTGESDTTSSPLLNMIRKDQQKQMDAEMVVNTAETKDEPFLEVDNTTDVPLSFTDKYQDVVDKAVDKAIEDLLKKVEKEEDKEEDKKEDEAKSTDKDDDKKEEDKKEEDKKEEDKKEEDNADKKDDDKTTAADASINKASSAAFAAAQAANVAVAGIKEAINASVEAALKNKSADTEKLSEAEINQILGEDTVRMYMQAEDLARLVDFIPQFNANAIGNSDNKIQIRYDGGSFSDAYKFALRYSQVMKSESSEEDKAKLAELRSLLQVETTIPGIAALGEPDKTVLEDSPLVQAYNERMLAYNSAALQYNNKRIAALTAKDPQAVHDWAMNAPIYENNKNAAMSMWKTRGYKEQYEKITAAISQMEQRDFTLAKEECWKALERSLCTGISSGSDFYFTTLSPASFMRSDGWTRLSFKQTDYTSENIEKTKNHALHADTSAKYSGIFTGAEAHYSNDQADHNQSLDSSFDLTDFEISLEICQVNIVRPWFKPTFLNSRYWRFDQGNVITKTQYLSDGNSSGLLPAYTTAIVFIRNVEIHFGSEQNTKNFIHNYKSTEHAGGAKASVNFLFINTEAGFNVGNKDENTEDSFKLETHIKDNTLRIPGTQIIGYCCHRLGLCPDPHPEITEWI